MEMNDELGLYRSFGPKGTSNVDLPESLD
eukprot:SAG22_NODE_21963_length_252_cov_1.019608_1_plen_28_part_10